MRRSTSSAKVSKCEPKKRHQALGSDQPSSWEDHRENFTRGGGKQTAQFPINKGCGIHLRKKKIKVKEELCGNPGALIALQIGLSPYSGHRGQRTNCFVRHHCKNTENKNTLPATLYKLRESSPAGTLVTAHQER